MNNLITKILILTIVFLFGYATGMNIEKRNHQIEIDKMVRAGRIESSYGSFIIVPEPKIEVMGKVSHRSK